MEETFLTTLILELEDIKFEVETDLGTDSVPYHKIKSLLETVEDYRDSLP